MAKDTKRPFFIALHDVSVDTHEVCAHELNLLAQSGIQRCTLLVIPDSARGVTEEFRRALRRFQADGHELALHGYRHHAEPGYRRGLAGQLALRLTHGEAEFAGLALDDSKDLLEQALRAWDRLGLGRAAGFTPPTWHSNPWLVRQSMKIGWDFHEERFSIYLRGKRSPLTSVPVSLAGLSPTIQALSLSLARHLVPHLPGVPRLVLHPGELSGAQGADWLGLVKEWQKWGRPVSVQEILTFRP